jgi:catechol 1,2-dioxygenase
MLAASARHPWRPAHIHVAVNVEGFEPLATHIFDSESAYLDSDAVFAVKPSLIKRFVRRSPDDRERPAGISGAWWSLETDFVLAPATDNRG